MTSASHPPGPRATARLVTCGVVANFAVGGLFAWSLVAPEVMADVGAPQGSGPAVFAVALAVFTAVVLGVGRGLRALGPRRLLAAAAVLAGAGLGLTAAGQRPEVPWLGIGLLFGAANGLAYGVALSLAAQVAEERRGTASGLVVGAYAAGPVLLGLVGPRVVPAAGWRTCLAVLAVLVAALVALAAALAPSERVGSPPSGPVRRPVPRRTVITLWLLFAGAAAPALVIFATAAPLATARGLDAEAAGMAVSLLAAGNLVGRLVAGWWSDRIGRAAAMATALALPAAAILVLSATAVAIAVLGGFLAIGLAYGAISALVPAATADRVGAEAFPAVYGRVFTAWGCAGLGASFLGGVVIGADGQRPVALLTIPLVVAAAALLFLPRGGAG